MHGSRFYGGGCVAVVAVLIVSACGTTTQPDASDTRAIGQSKAAMASEEWAKAAKRSPDEVEHGRDKQHAKESQGEASVAHPRPPRTKAVHRRVKGLRISGAVREGKLEEGIAGVESQIKDESKESGGR